MTDTLITRVSWLRSAIAMNDLGSIARGGNSRRDTTWAMSGPEGSAQASRDGVGLNEPGQGWWTGRPPDVLIRWRHIDDAARAVLTPGICEGIARWESWWQWIHDEPYEYFIHSKHHAYLPELRDAAQRLARQITRDVHALMLERLAPAPVPVIEQLVLL